MKIPQTRRRQVREASLHEFQTRLQHVASPDLPPPPRRKRWTERASEELEAAMRFDLKPDRRSQYTRVPSYERLAEHLEEKGFK